jgi:hypothetical protein
MEELSLFDAWTRFDCFHDSVIRRAEFHLRRPRRLDIDLVTWDRKAANGGTEVDVRFRFDDVKEYRLWEQNWTIEVISEAAWAKFDDLIWVAFDGDFLDGDSTATVDEFRARYAYVAAKAVKVTAKPSRRSD